MSIPAVPVRACVSILVVEFTVECISITFTVLVRVCIETGTSERVRKIRYILYGTTVRKNTTQKEKKSQTQQRGFEFSNSSSCSFVEIDNFCCSYY